MKTPSRKTVELLPEQVRDVQRKLRKKRIAEGELVLDDWEDETDETEVCTMEELIMSSLIESE